MHIKLLGSDYTNKTRGPWALTLCLRTNMAIGQVQKLHIHEHSLSIPGGSKLSLFLLYGQRFPRYGPIFKIPIFGHETWQVAKVTGVAHVHSFYPKGLKLRLFYLYGQWFPRYWAIFKIVIFGMKLGKWPKFQKLHVYNLDYSRVPNFTPFCSTIAPFPDTWGFWFLHRVQWWI